jgi:hypothetical protein
MELLLRNNYLKKKFIKYISALDFYNLKGSTKKLNLLLPRIKIKQNELHDNHIKYSDFHD